MKYPALARRVPGGTGSPGRRDEPYRKTEETTMRRWITRGLGIAILALGLVGLLAPIDADGGETFSRPGAVRIGLISTLFRDTPPTLIEPMMRPFKGLMEAQTGLTGQMVVAN